MSVFTTRAEPPTGHIHLLLLLHAQSHVNVQSENEFFLEIPVSFIQQHYLSPLKFLLYLGWCILGTHGQLLNDQYQEVPLDEQLRECQTYYYKPEETDNPFKYAVDLEAVRVETKSNTSESTARHGDFRINLLQRDGTCVFTGGDGATSAIHIIPHRKGDEWLKLIVANRPNDVPASDINSIDDIRNGMLCDERIHRSFDRTKAVILKTPNDILKVDDVVPRCRRIFPLPPDCTYPSDSRYTLHLFDIPANQTDQLIMPDNNDATFLTSSSLPKPSALLLNYSYGAAAVKNWGRNTSIFSIRPGIPRPKVVTPAMGPTRTLGPVNRDCSAKKGKLREGGEQEAGLSGTVQGTQDPEQELDAHELILYFWANSRPARERREREQQDREDYIKGWASSVPFGMVD